MEALISKKVAAIIDLSNFEKGMQEFIDSEFELMEFQMDKKEIQIEKKMGMLILKKNGKHATIEDVKSIKTKLKIR